MNRSLLLDSFMEEHDLVAVDNSICEHIGHTYEHDDGYSTSWPDHFLTNSEFASNFKSIKSLRCGSNLYDHHPL